MKNLINILSYLLMLGPPRALQIHADAQEQGGELDGMPVWLVYAAELVMRTGVFLVISWGLQEALSHEIFRRFQVFFLIVAVFVSGFVHTAVHLYCFGMMWGVWSKIVVGRVYRTGRNLSYSIIPAFPAAGAVLVWQDHNQIALFQGDLVENTFFATWVIMALLGVAEALLVKRKPLGIVLRQVKST